MTGFPLVESLQSRLWCLTLHFQTSDMLGSLRVVVSQEQCHISYAFWNQYTDACICMCVRIYISPCLCVCQFVNFQWELSSRLDCLIWQISTLSPSRQAFGEAKSLIWRSTDDEKYSCQIDPAFLTSILFLLARYMGTMLQRLPVEHGKRTQGIFVWRSIS